MKIENVLMHINDSRCYSCSACKNICPAGAISMKENTDGFLRPFIDSTKCIGCKLCIKVCPSLNRPNDYSNKLVPDTYAAYASDDIRLNASSGGIFPLLANFVLDEGGYVCGVIFDKDWNAKHIVTDKKSDISLISKSKYVQSDVGSCFLQIKNFLKQGKMVLFSGTPCQVAGLKNYIAVSLKEIPENLLLVEVLCHGNPSRKVWRKYKSEICGNNDIADINFRPKGSYGVWTSPRFILKNGKKIVFPTTKDLYMKSFLSLMTVNNTCGLCKFAKLPRQADVTIGDFWGYHRAFNCFNDGKGISLILINNQKGKNFFDNIVHKLKFNAKVPFVMTEEKHTKVPQPIKANVRSHYFRNDFFNMLDKQMFCDNARYYLEKKIDVCLLTCFYCENYGSILVAYAAYEIIKKLGYEILMLQKPTTFWGDAESYMYGNTIPQQFAKKHYNLSKIYNSYAEMRELNRVCRTFVVASDILFASFLPFKDFCYLQFVKDDRKKIGYCVSFGNDSDKHLKYFDAHPEYKDYLRRFNKLSTRDDPSKINGCFGVKMDELIDPTLILPKDFYIKLMNKQVKNRLIKNRYLLVYLLHYSDEKKKIAEFIAQKLGLEIVNIEPLAEHERKENMFNNSKICSVEEFLNLFKFADFVFTDSFHGTCFSVKFNKRFITLHNADSLLRFKIFEKLGVSSRIISDSQTLFNDDTILYKKINFSQISKKIRAISEKSINWIDNSIKSSVIEIKKDN